MTVSTDAILCYGIAFGEDYEFPWTDKYEGDEEAWYYSEVVPHKYPFELSWEKGYACHPDGTKAREEEIDRYFWHYINFTKENPMPFELVRHCGGEYPLYTLAVPGTVIRARRGYPVVFDSYTDILNKIDVEKLGKYEQFMYDHFGNLSKLKWILASYWG